MCSDFLFRLCIIMIAVVLTFDGPSAKQRKCVYFFGTCYSCEAPLTCENSRPVDEAASPSLSPSPSPSPKKRSTVLRSDPPPLPDTKVRPDAASTPKPSTDSLARSQLRQSTDFDREFKQFQIFMRDRQIDGQPPDTKKLQEMYFAYRLWLSRQSRPSGATAN